MSTTLWILGGLVAGLVLVGIAELLKGPRGPHSREQQWWNYDND